MEKITKMLILMVFALHLEGQVKEFKQDSETVKKVVEEYKKVLESSGLLVPDTIYVSKEYKRAVEEGRIPSNTFKWLISAGEVALSPVFHLIANNRSLHPVVREVGIGIIGVITEKTGSKKGINYLWKIVKDTVKTGKKFMGRDWQDWARVDAFLALAGQKDTSITKPLMEILKKEKNDGLKSEMIVGLGMRGDKRVAPYIVEILREYKRKYPKNVWDDGGQFKTGISLVVARCYTALGNLKAKEYINEFIDVIKDTELSWIFKMGVIGDLRGMGKDAKPAVPALLELLEKEMLNIPHYALHQIFLFFEDTKDERVIPILRKNLEKLKRKDILDWEDAIVLLALYGDKSVVEDFKEVRKRMEKMPAYKEKIERASKILGINK